jgi:hypothetical protein
METKKMDSQAETSFRFTRKRYNGEKHLFHLFKEELKSAVGCSSKCGMKAKLFLFTNYTRSLMDPTKFELPEEFTLYDFKASLEISQLKNVLKAPVNLVLALLLNERAKNSIGLQWLPERTFDAINWCIKDTMNPEDSVSYIQRTDVDAHECGSLQPNKTRLEETKVNAVKVATASKNSGIVCMNYKSYGHIDTTCLSDFCDHRSNKCPERIKKNRKRSKKDKKQEGSKSAPKASKDSSDSEGAESEESEEKIVKKRKFKVNTVTAKKFAKMSYDFSSSSEDEDPYRIEQAAGVRPNFPIWLSNISLFRGCGQDRWNKKRQSP